jgi:alanine dehydrogenase
MIVGVPKEIKDNEYRVSLTPAGAEMLVANGHRVLVESAAGEGSGFVDAEYAEAGAKVVLSAKDVWGQADMIVKVKEPIRSEYGYLREGLLLFTYLHLAADEALTRVLLEKRVTGVAYETVETSGRTLPLLIPMSEVAGRMAIQVAAQYLEKSYGGRGKLLGGVPGVRPCEVVVVGAGVVGKNAAQIALGMGAHVTVIDIMQDKLVHLSDVLHGSLTTLSSNRRNIADCVRVADVVVGSVLIPGAKAPKLVTREMISSMVPGSVVIDVAVDQGGCVETCHPTTHSNPTFLVDGVTHYCVANMPGAVPRTSTYALSNVTLPYAIKLANNGFARAVASDAALAKGVNTYNGQVTYAAVADAFGLTYTSLDRMLSRQVVLSVVGSKMRPPPRLSFDRLGHSPSGHRR